MMKKKRRGIGEGMGRRRFGHVSTNSSCSCFSLQGCRITVLGPRLSIPGVHGRHDTWTWRTSSDPHPKDGSRCGHIIAKTSTVWSCCNEKYCITIAAGKLNQLPGLGGKEVNFPSSPSETVNGIPNFHPRVREERARQSESHKQSHNVNNEPPGRCFKIRN
jgi:hypothetical protein